MPTYQWFVQSVSNLRCGFSHGNKEKRHFSRNAISKPIVATARLVLSVARVVKILTVGPGGQRSLNGNFEVGTSMGTPDNS